MIIDHHCQCQLQCRCRLAHMTARAPATQVQYLDKVMAWLAAARRGMQIGVQKRCVGTSMISMYVRV